MRSFISGNPPIYVDMSELESTIEHLRLVLTRDQFEKVMYRTFGEVGRRSKTMIGREVVQDYAVTQQWVKSQIGSYQLSFGGEFPVTCKIPLKGHKGSIGGRFALSSPARSRRQGRVRARIVRAGVSTMPQRMDNQGGNPPFVANGVAFTRRTKARFPIVRVVGLGVPQMPLNRSEEKVKDALLDYAGQRLEHHFQRMIKGNW